MSMRQADWADKLADVALEAAQLLADFEHAIRPTGSLRAENYLERRGTTYGEAARQTELRLRKVLSEQTPESQGGATAGSGLHLSAQIEHQNPCHACIGVLQNGGKAGRLFIEAKYANEVCRLLNQEAKANDP